MDSSRTGHSHPRLVDVGARNTKSPTVAGRASFAGTRHPLEEVHGSSDSCAGTMDALCTAVVVTLERRLVA